jgi:hypothetical protein
VLFWHTRINLLPRGWVRPLPFLRQRRWPRRGGPIHRFLQKLARRNLLLPLYPAVPNRPIRIRWVSFSGAPSDRERCAIRSIMTTFDPIAQLSFSCAIRSSSFRFILSGEGDVVCCARATQASSALLPCLHASRVCVCACAPLIGCPPRNLPSHACCLKSHCCGLEA